MGSPGAEVPWVGGFPLHPPIGRLEVDRPPGQRPAEDEAAGLSERHQCLLPKQ